MSFKLGSLNFIRSCQKSPFSFCLYVIINLHLLILLGLDRFHLSSPTSISRDFCITFFMFGTVRRNFFCKTYFCKKKKEKEVITHSIVLLWDLMHEIIMPNIEYYQFNWKEIIAYWWKHWKTRSTLWIFGTNCCWQDEIDLLDGDYFYLICASFLSRSNYFLLSTKKK